MYDTIRHTNNLGELTKELNEYNRNYRFYNFNTLHVLHFVVEISCEIFLREKVFID